MRYTKKSRCGACFTAAITKLHGQLRVSATERTDPSESADERVSDVGEAIAVSRRRDTMTRLNNRSVGIVVSGKRECIMLRGKQWKGTLQRRHTV